jgi:hypothetical protein
LWDARVVNKKFYFASLDALEQCFRQSTLYIPLDTHPNSDIPPDYCALTPFVSNDNNNRNNRDFTWKATIGKFPFNHHPLTQAFIPSAEIAVQGAPEGSLYVLNLDPGTCQALLHVKNQNLGDTKATTDRYRVLVGYCPHRGSLGKFAYELPWPYYPKWRLYCDFEYFPETGVCTAVIPRSAFVELADATVKEWDYYSLLFLSRAVPNRGGVCRMPKGSHTKDSRPVDFHARDLSLLRQPSAQSN